MFFQITQYANAKDPKISKVTTLKSVLQIIKDGDDKLPLIQAARAVGKANPLYNTIKTTSLATFRFNFLFDSGAANKNIIAPTGLIYLDADSTDSIPDSPLVLAKWKSLSNTGYGILVKVNGLTLDNYKDTYNHLSHLIGIDSDAGARKATQQTIQSYDPNLYYNPDAEVYVCTESKKVSHPPIEKREKCIGTNDTFFNGSEDAIRFNNIGDYFTGEYADTYYRVFNEKARICSPFIPFKIDEGKRNSTLFYLLSQYSLLNPSVGKPWLKAIAGTINKKMYPNLSEREISLVIDSVLKKRGDGSLELYFNEERRVLFNPTGLLTSKQKMEIVNRELGRLKSDFTKEVIYLVLENWDFDADGKITQRKVSKYANRSEATIKRHWSDFKDYARDLNASNKKANKKAVKISFSITKSKATAT